MVMDLMQNQRQVGVTHFPQSATHWNWYADTVSIDLPVIFPGLFLLTMPVSFVQQEVPLFSSDGSWFYLTLPAKQGARGEFRHIASLPAQVSVRTLKLLYPCVILQWFNARLLVKSSIGSGFAWLPKLLALPRPLAFVSSLQWVWI